jgi:hypothetical protein
MVVELIEVEEAEEEDVRNQTPKNQIMGSSST